MGRRLLTAFACAAGTGAIWAAPASADHGDLHLPWAELLPPQHNTPVAVQPQPLKSCRRATLRCVRHVIRRMTVRWRPLDRRCDHRAVFALTYLRTTEAFYRTIKRNRRYFKDFNYIVLEDVLFAVYYFTAYDRYVRGRGFVPDAWRIAFDAAASGDYNAGQDVLLGMNAHIQRDLPYVLARLGLRGPDGTSRKPDHDKVNRILTRVLDPVQREMARRYDRFMSFSDAKPAPADELSALELLKSWREGAWRNAERLLNARSDAEKAFVRESIESNARTWAQRIAARGQPGYRAERDAWCARRFR
jgi:hypothetical protein